MAKSVELNRSNEVADIQHLSKSITKDSPRSPSVSSLLPFPDPHTPFLTPHY